MSILSANDSEVGPNRGRGNIPIIRPRKSTTFLKVSNRRRCLDTQNTVPVVPETLYRLFSAGLL